MNVDPFVSFVFGVLAGIFMSVAVVAIIMAARESVPEGCSICAAKAKAITRMSFTPSDFTPEIMAFLSEPCPSCTHSCGGCSQKGELDE